VLSERFTPDALRYFLLREMPFGQDGAYSTAGFIARVNADLANTLGNLVTRTAAMVGQYFGGVLPAPSVATPFCAELLNSAAALFDKVRASVDALTVSDALAEIIKVAGRANKYIDETAPWLLAKDPAKKDELGTVLYNLAETIRIIAVTLSPFLIELPAKILSIFGEVVPASFEGNTAWGKLKAGLNLNPHGVIFKRIDAEMELREPEEPKKETKNMINYDEFAKVELRVGKVEHAEAVPKSEKLLKLTVLLGEEKRTIVSGIAKFYSAEDMLGKSVVVVTNLAPAKLCGIVSEGMILCADGADGKVVLVEPSADCPHGSVVR
jgi:methionyl-tRNA synthetase